VTECSLSAAGHDYIGDIDVTVSGKTCQAWTSQFPHEHEYNEDHMFPDGIVKNASNHCRNPDYRYVGIWCYTTDPDQRWELCDVPTCGQST